MKSISPKITEWKLVLVVAVVAQAAFGDVTINSTTFKIGATSGNNTVVSNWLGTAFPISAAVYVGANGNAAGFGNNSVTISNFAITSPTGAYLEIGNSSANNTLTLLANTTWSDPGGAVDLYVGAINNSSNNTLNIIGGTLSLAGSDSFICVGGGGSGAAVTGANGNSLIVTNGGVLDAIADLYVGASYHNGYGGAGATSGSGNNTVILSNSVIDASHSDGGYGINVGYGSSNNILTFLPNTEVIIGGSTRGGLDVGYGGSAFNNVITVNGAIVSNTGPLSVGYGTGSPTISNQLAIINGGIVRDVTSLVVGGASGAAYNSLIVTNGGSYIQTAGAVLIGSGIGDNVGGGNNTVILGNSTINATTEADIGYGSSNNTVTLLANTVWNQGNHPLYVGMNAINLGAGAYNVLTLSGGVLTNFSLLKIGNQSSLVVSNGSVLAAPSGAGSVSFAGNGGTIMVGSGGLITGAGTLFNNAAYGNTVMVGSGGVWSNGSNPFIGVGGGNNSSNNVLDIVGGTVLLTGSAAVSGDGDVFSVGGDAGAHATITGANGNTLVVTNGGSLYLNGDLYVGASYNNGGGGAGAGTGGGNNTAILSNSVIDDSFEADGIIVGYGSSNNTLTLLPNTVVIGSAGGLAIGYGGPAVSNVVTISGALYTNAGSVTIGHSATSVANQLVVNNGGVLSNVTGLTVGSNGGSFNNLTISNNGAVFLDSGSVSVGSSGGNNNSVVIGAGGLLAASSLNVFSGGTGNTISNLGGIYQFNTATPTIANGGFGNIVINNGAVSFTGINNANVSNSLGNGAALSGISFSGANTFMLNSASNTTAGQTYDFQAVGGNPSNYAGLAMINGQTAYRGGDITVGTSGSMLLSNTLGTISGLVTNQGSLTVVGSAATFQSQVVNTGTASFQNSIGTFNNGVINAGHWLSDPSTNVFGSFGYTNTASGAISMSAGDVYIFTNTQTGVAANFVNLSTNNVANNMANGKFLFSGGLGLTQTLYAAGHDLGPGQLTPILTATNIVSLGNSTILGYTNNFSIGTLEISNFSTVRVDDAFLGVPGLGSNDNLVAGLYLQNLILGANSLLIIDTNVQVYFENSNGWSLANIRLENNQSSVYGGDAYNYNNSIDGLHQIAVVPEPSVLLMALLGAATVWFVIRRQRYRQRNSLRSS